MRESYQTAVPRPGVAWDLIFNKCTYQRILVLLLAILEAIILVSATLRGDQESTIGVVARPAECR